MTSPTQDTTQAELREMITKLSGSGAHACYCERSTDGGCTCALKDEYTAEIMEVIDAHTKAQDIKARADELTWFRGYYHKEMSGTVWGYLNKRIAELEAELKALQDLQHHKEES